MARSKRDLFCFFSGFAHQDTQVIEFKKDPKNGLALITCLNNSKHTLLAGNYIQLDGVLFEITETKVPYFKACSTLELIKDTSINAVKVGDKLTLGVVAEKDLSHDRLWMLQPSALGQVTYKSYSTAEGHEHTLKLDFEAPKNLAPLIQEDHHLGLAGSSLTAKHVLTETNLVKFSIYCGRETRENSQFNENLQPDTQVNITESAEVVDTKCAF